MISDRNFATLLQPSKKYVETTSQYQKINHSKSFIKQPLSPFPVLKSNFFYEQKASVVSIFINNIGKGERGACLRYFVEDCRSASVDLEVYIILQMCLYRNLVTYSSSFSILACTHLSYPIHVGIALNFGANNISNHYTLFGQSTHPCHKY